MCARRRASACACRQARRWTSRPSWSACAACAPASATTIRWRVSALGVDVFLGDGPLHRRPTVEVDGRRLEFARPSSPPGARAARRPFPGSPTVGFLTNETVFRLTELPRRLAVIGAGPIGCELAQAFARFGAEVDLLDRRDVLPQGGCRRGGDRRAPACGATACAVTAAAICGSAARGTEKIADRTRWTGRRGTVVGDHVLLGGGRAPNVEGLGLEQVGVAYSTARRHGRRRPADHQPAHLRGRRRLLAVQVHARRRRHGAHRHPERALLRAQDVPARCTCRGAPTPIPRSRTSASHGRDAAAAGHRRGRRSPSHARRTSTARILDGEDARVSSRSVVRKGSDRLLGADHRRRHAGEMICEVAAGDGRGIGPRQLRQRRSTPIRRRPRRIRKLGDAYNRTRLTPRVKRLFERLLAWRL